MKLFRRFDYLPTVDSYFLQRSMTGILCSYASTPSSLVSVLAVLCIVSYNIVISFASGVWAFRSELTIQAVRSSFSIDVDAPDTVDMDVAFQSP